MALTLQEVEAAVGYTVAAAVDEYLVEELYGDPSDWTAEAAAEAEIKGDAGDQIADAFEGDEIAEAQDIWRAAFIDAFEEAQ